MASASFVTDPDLIAALESGDEDNAVTDPDLIAALESGDSVVTDPDLISALESGDAPPGDQRPDVVLPTPTMGEVVRAIPRVTGAGFRQAAGGAIEAAGDVAGLPSIQETGKRIGERGRELEDAATPSFMSFGQRAVLDAGTSLGTVAPLAAGSTLAGAGALGLAGGAGALEAGGSYSQARDAGKDPGEAGRFAAINGIIETGTELLPAKALFKQGSGPLRRLTQFMASELPGENLATIGQMVNARMHELSDELSAGDFIEAIKRTSAATVLAGGVQSGVASGFDAARPKAPEIAPQAATEGTESDATQNLPGAAHVGMINPPAEAADNLKDIPEPLRREHILKKFADAVGAPIYTGRVRNPKVAGFFRPKNTEVRLKNHNDLEVAAHEIAHYLDDQNPTFKAAYTDPQFDEEIRGVSYDSGKLEEGFAEFVRLWATQPEQATQAAPKFSAKFEELITGTKDEAPLRTARHEMTAWYNQGALARFDSKIGEKPPPLWDQFKQWKNRLGDRVILKTLDDLQGVKAAEKMMNGDLAQAGESPYKAMRLVRGARGVATAVLERGTIGYTDNGSIEFTGDGLHQIFEPVANDLENTLRYFRAKRAKELAGRGITSGFTTDEIDAALTEGNKNPRIKRAFVRYQLFNSRMMDFYEESGLIGPESRAKMEEMNKDYVPFTRVMEDLEGKDVGKFAQAFKRIKGSTRNVKDTWEAITGNSVMMIDAALKNRARLMTFDMLGKKGGARFAAKIARDQAPVDVNMAKIEKALGKRGLTVAPVGPNAAPESVPDFLTIFQPKDPKGNNIERVLRDGKSEFYEVQDPLLKHSLDALGPQRVSTVMRALGLPKKWLTIGVTSMPDFQVVNLMRDSMSGWMLSKAGHKPMIDSLKGAVDTWKKTDAYWEFMANGGGMSTLREQERQDAKERIETWYSDRGIDRKKVLDTPARAVRAYSEVLSGFELGTRVAEANRLREKGTSAAEATFQGREISTDFAMRGMNDLVRFFAQTVPFMNARVQGLYRVGREVGEKGGDHRQRVSNMMMRGGLGLMLPSVMLYLMNHDDEKYKALPEEVKDLHWVIRIPWRDEMYLIPKPFELGQIFGTLPERITQALIDRDDKLAPALKTMLLESFSLDPTPQAIKPGVDIARNKRFGDVPIVSSTLEDVLPEDQVSAGTTESMRRLGAKWNVSPAQLQHLVTGYFGTLGQYALQASDAMLPEGERGEAPTKRVDEWPVVRRFIRQQPLSRSAYEQDFYEIAQQTRELVNSIRLRTGEGRNPESLLDTPKEQKLYGLDGPVQDVKEQASVLRERERQIRSNPQLSGEEKAKEIEAIRKQRNDLFAQAYRAGINKHAIEP